VTAIRERPVQRYSEVFGFGAVRQGFVVEVDFQTTFSFLVVEVEDYRHRFCSAELYLPDLDVFTYSHMSLLNTPSTILELQKIQLNNYFRGF